MKRTISIFLLLALCLSLCACGSKEEDAQPQLPGSVDPETGAWRGQGGCYRTELVELPEDAGDHFCREGRIYAMGSPSMDETLVYRDGEELFRCEGRAYRIAEGDEGVWLLEEEREDDTTFVKLSLYSYVGETQKQLRLEMPPDCYPLGLCAADGLLYLKCSDSVRVYDGGGDLVCSFPGEDWSGRLIKAGDGSVCLCAQGQNGGGSVSVLDPRQGTVTELFRYEKGCLSGGDGESPFLLLLPEGLYRVERTGETRPLAIWDECLVSVNGAVEAEPLGDGRFLLSGMWGDPLLLVPAEPADIKPKTMLTLAVLPSQTMLDFGGDPVGYYAGVSQSITAFNAQSPDCYVKLVDLSEGGSLTAEQALTRLNTQLLSGEGPDMLVLDGALSPFFYIRQGLLRDFKEDLEADPDLRAEDLVLTDAILNDCGGLYVMTDAFTLDTRIGLRSRFGETWGWSFDDYYRIDAETPEGRMVMYNLTRDYFLNLAVSRYLRQGIDWQKVSCDFDNPAFVRVLEATRDVHETPEDPNNMVFGDNLMADGYIVTDLIMVNTVTDLARESRRVGQPISVIGFPTPDGSCGTDFFVGNPIGVLRNCAHPELCWKFLKYCLLHPGDFCIPNYRPLLERQLEEARHIDPDADYSPWYDGLRSPMTEEEIAFFLELLDRIEHTSLCDEEAMDIVRAEMAPFLAGERSAEETADIIQRRMSLYVAEQG